MDIKKLLSPFEGGECYLLCFTSTKVSLGEYKNGEYRFLEEGINLEEVKQIHAFNEMKENRYIEGLGYILLDDEELKYESFDESMFLLGTLDSDFDHNILIQGGRRLALPFPIDINTFGDGVKLKVRNYVDYDERDRAYIKASRLVGFMKEE